MDAFTENQQYIAQADSVTPGSHIIEDDKIIARHDTDFMIINKEQVNYIDLSPKQLVSVSTALIPFLEHDDASRALMGANMQRQAVPLITTEAPLVGTGMEREIAKASTIALTTRRSGIVDYVSSDKIIIRADEDQFQSFEDWVAQGVDTYQLKKFQNLL